MKEAKARWGDALTIAALGALKQDPKGESFRVIHDASNRVLVNHRIGPRDRLRYPTVGDLAAVISEVAEEQTSRFAL
eukprot:4048802-Heterocapsa_arctica.AAC.1